MRLRPKRTRAFIELHGAFAKWAIGPLLDQSLAGGPSRGWAAPSLEAERGIVERLVRARVAIQGGQGQVLARRRDPNSVDTSSIKFEGPTPSVAFIQELNLRIAADAKVDKAVT